MRNKLQTEILIVTVIWSWNKCEATNYYWQSKLKQISNVKSWQLLVEQTSNFTFKQLLTSEAEINDKLQILIVTNSRSKCQILIFTDLRIFEMLNSGNYQHANLKKMLNSDSWRTVKLAQMANVKFWVIDARSKKKQLQTIEGWTKCQILTVIEIWSWNEY